MVFLEKLFRKNGTVYECLQYSTTGAFGYSIRRHDKEVFRISSLVLPNPDIYMSGFGKELVHKHLNCEITLVSGICRRILNINGKEEGFFLYRNFETYLIATGDTVAFVKASAAGWEIYREKKRLADIKRVNETDRLRLYENGCEMERKFLINIYKDAELELYPYIMAIPILGF